jgi:hypothetical protein
MTAPDAVLRLIERYNEQIEDYRAGRYKEAQVRNEFIDPLFAALGWDVHNKQGYAEAYKEVIHEDSLTVGGSAKAPDYCFRVGGTQKFFVEAKKPSVNIKDTPGPAFQLRRYAWSAKLPLSVLTDFEEFAVYDCRISPDKRDGPSVARILYLNHTDYADRWEEIASVFSKEAILKGSFDRYVESKKGKRGTAEVDAAFLKEIETWREELARNIAIRNGDLSQRELNFAVQRTIDRIVFLRICEDRGIEKYGRLQALCEKKEIYKGLLEFYYRADERYNSGLFHFRPEKGRIGAPDELSLSLNIDDRVLKGILARLYYPDSPYEFAVLPAEILGQVYEQFLGKVIRLTKGHQAKVEEKPEVRKAGGVYYTPKYIVDYIVANTVGKLVEGKTPKQVEKLSVLDPACGSGSFLLGAYQYLLDWHLAYYTENDRDKWLAGKNPRLVQKKADDYRLTTWERKRILLANLYGVDIDPQAVEVTKLSLLLKVLEGETGETIAQQQKLFHERALPDLGANIKCGNSLIGPDFYTHHQTNAFDEEERYRINVFDWKAEFAEIMKAGGFDAVIGNPPYIRIQALKEWAPIEVEHYKAAYQSASKGNYDIYVVFIERGLSLLNDKGLVGFIVPHKFFTAKYGESIRRLISSGNHLSHTVHFGDKQVFENATTYTCLVFLKSVATEKIQYSSVDHLVDWVQSNKCQVDSVNANNISEKEWAFGAGPLFGVLSRLKTFPLTLAGISHRIFQGLVTGSDAVFVLEKRGEDSFFSEATGDTYTLENDLLHPLGKGSVNLRRYHVAEVSKWIIFPYRIIDGRAHLLSPSEIDRNHPKTWQYLLENRRVLEARERGKWKHDRWYALGRTQNLTQMDQSKILTPSIANRASFTLDKDGFLYFLGSGGGGGGGYGITLKADCDHSYYFVTGLLNSRLLDAFVKSITSRFRGGYYAYNRQYIEQIPIRPIDFSDHADKARHDKMVELVEGMLALHKRAAGAKTGHEQTSLARQIEATDAQIDRLVYEFYGLTESEIEIVEEAAR